MVEPVGPAGPTGEPSAAAPATGPGGLAVDRALRIVGGVVAVTLAAVTALIEIFYTPLRMGGVLVGVSVALAVVVNFFLPRFTVAVTGSGWVALLPPLAWFALTMVAAGKRPEGDILLTSWMGLLMIFAGSVAFAVGGYRLINPPPGRPGPGKPSAGKTAVTGIDRAPAQ